MGGWPVATKTKGSKGAGSTRKANRNRRPVRKARTSRKRAAPAGGVFPVEVGARPLEETLRRVREQLVHWAKKGRYTKVRFKFRGKPLLPDLPVGALLAAEAMTFWWAGLLRVLLMNLGAKALLDVELVHDAEEELARGKEALLSGELDAAAQAFSRAVQMDRSCAPAHLNLGVVAKLRGDWEAAKAAWRKAEELDPAGACGEEARQLLASARGSTV